MKSLNFLCAINDTSGGGVAPANDDPDAYRNWYSAKKRRVVRRRNRDIYRAVNSSLTNAGVHLPTSHRRDTRLPYGVIQ